MGSLVLATVSAGTTSLSTVTAGRSSSASIAPGRSARGILADEDEPLYIAHRGGASVYPEATMEAFRAASAAGARLLEPDCYLLSDGSLGVMHDPTVDRTTTSTGNVVSYTAATWAGLTIDAGTWFGGGWGNLTPPLFVDVCREFANRYTLVPEAKSSGAGAAIAAQIVSSGAQDACLVQSFSQSELTPAAAAGIACILLVGASEPNYSALLAAGIRYVGFPSDVSAAWIANALAAGVKVIVYTINRHAERDPFIALGVIGFFVDEPIYCSGAGYQRTSDPYTTQTWYHGHLAGLASRGTFTPPNWWGFAINGAASDFVLQGWACPITSPTSFTIDFTAIMDAKNAAGRWLSLFVATNDLAWGDSGATPRNGYHCLLRESGTLDLYRVTAGAATNIASASTSALVMGVTQAQMRLTVTPSAVTWRRLDVAGTASANDSTYRPLPYFHFGRNGAGGRFKGVTVS